MDEDDYNPLASVDLPIPFGSTLHLYPSGRVAVITSEGDCELDDGHIDAATDLLLRARMLRRATA